MIKTKEVKQVKKEYYCDECKIKINKHYTCDYCKKDLCYKCIAHCDDTGDYIIDVHCKECYEIAKPFYDKINKLENEIDNLYAKAEIAIQNKL